MWHVLLTEPNRERTAARHLQLLGGEIYLPVYPKASCRRVSGGRRWQVFRRPLFPGYLFIRRHDDLWVWIRIAAGIRQSLFPFLGHGGRPAMIASAKISEIRVLEREISLSRSRRMRFRIGDRVLVRDGAFTGLKASVYQLTDSERVSLLLDFLGQKAKVTIGVDQLDAVA